MKIVFMGTPSYATEILKGLLDHHKIVGVFTQPDKPAGRKKILTPPHVKQYLIDENIKTPIFQPENLKDPQSEELIKNLKPDFIIVAAYGQILPQNILNIAPCINLHASILPYFRGASPIQSAILENENFTGVSAMMMEAGLDCGDMLGFSYVKIENKTSFELFDELAIKAKELILKVLNDFENLKPISQKNLLTSYSPKIQKIDGEVDFETMNAKDIFIKYKAYTPWPGIFLADGLKVIECEFCEETAQPNTILKADKNGVLVACKSGSILLKQIQPPTKQKMSAFSYVVGLRKEVGSLFF